MTPAEAEFDVTDGDVVKSLLAGLSGPVVSGPVFESLQPEVQDSFAISMGSLRTRTV